MPHPYCRANETDAQREERLRRRRERRAAKRAMETPEDKERRKARREERRKVRDEWRKANPGKQTHEEYTRRAYAKADKEYRKSSPPPPPPFNPQAHSWIPTKTRMLRILGLDDGATEGAIKSAYRKMVLLHHPDKGGDEEKFKEIQSAYEWLTGRE